jgi:hypothetical protein
MICMLDLLLLLQLLPTGLRGVRQQQRAAAKHKLLLLLLLLLGSL